MVLVSFCSGLSHLTYLDSAPPLVPFHLEFPGRENLVQGCRALITTEYELYLKPKCLHKGPAGLE